MRKIGLLIGLTAFAAAPALAADPATIDWAKVPVANVTLFYPGQSSYEWLRTSAHPGSKSVLDGQACITCHTVNGGPSLTIAGTLYPTAHEPDLCNGVDGASGAAVVITGFDGASVTLVPNSAGNFLYAAFPDRNAQFRTTVLSGNGSSWSMVGPAGFSEGAANSVCIRMDPRGVPYVAFSDEG